MMRHLHHPSCPAGHTTGAACICPAPVLCEDCGALDGFHALACTFWDDHCRACARPILDGAPSCPGPCSTSTAVSA